MTIRRVRRGQLLKAIIMTPHDRVASGSAPRMRHAPHRFHSLPASSASHLLLYVLLYVALAATIAVSAGCGSGGEVQLPCGPPMCELLASDGAEGDFFGDAVSISGDVSIVGAPGDRDNGTDSGSAYVYRFNGFEWYEEAKLVPSDGAAGDFFGTSVAVDEIGRAHV